MSVRLLNYRFYLVAANLAFRSAFGNAMLKNVSNSEPGIVVVAAFEKDERHQLFVWPIVQYRKLLVSFD